MAQMQPTTFDLPEPPLIKVTAAQPSDRRLRMPLWLVLLLRNPKGRAGIVIFGGVLALALFAPLIADRSSAIDFNMLSTRQAPSWHHLFGTTDQGSDVWAQVVWGARRSLLLGAAAGAIATVIAATLGIFAAYRGGLADDLINVVTNVFFVIPAIPLLVDVTAFLHQRGLMVMTMIIALTLWAFEARILRAQALTLKNRDFVQAAKVAGESTWRIV